jgi:molybdopterin/thiamine biosynthesis adenylyltransferase
MKRKRNLLILLIVVVLIGLIALVVAMRGSKDATFDQDFHVEDIENITKIFLADKENNHVLLQRVADADTNSDTTWTVDEIYPASKGMIKLLLETLHDMRIRQQVNKNAVPQAIKLLSANSTKCEVYQTRYLIDWFNGKLRLFPREKLTVTYFVGQETQDMMACFMYRKGDKVPYIIHIPGFRGYLTPRFVADPMSWRSHTIVHWDITHLQSVELDIPATPEESYKVSRQGDGFVFQKAGTIIDNFDTARVAQMLSCFQNLNFDEYASRVPNSNMDSSFNAGPRAILHITNTEGTTREVTTYIKYNNPTDSLVMRNDELYEMFDLNRLYAIIDKKDTVLIQYFVFDNILQPASFYLGQPSSPFAKE